MSEINGDQMAYNLHFLRSRRFKDSSLRALLCAGQVVGDIGAVSMKQLITSSKTLKPLLRQVLQAPWASPLMEFRYGIWVGVSGLMGVDGRQLGEANTRPVVFNRNIPAEVQSCKYKLSLIHISEPTRPY